MRYKYSITTQRLYIYDRQSGKDHGREIRTYITTAASIYQVPIPEPRNDLTTSNLRILIQSYIVLDRVSEGKNRQKKKNKLKTT